MHADGERCCEESRGGSAEKNGVRFLEGEEAGDGQAGEASNGQDRHEPED